LNKEERNTTTIDGQRKEWGSDLHTKELKFDEMGEKKTGKVK